MGRMTMYSFRPQWHPPCSCRFKLIVAGSKGGIPWGIAVVLWPQVRDGDAEGLSLLCVHLPAGYRA